MKWEETLSERLDILKNSVELKYVKIGSAFKISPLGVLWVKERLSPYNPSAYCRTKYKRGKKNHIHKWINLKTVVYLQKL